MIAYIASRRTRGPRHTCTIRDVRTNAILATVSGRTRREAEERAEECKKALRESQP